MLFWVAVEGAVRHGRAHDVVGLTIRLVKAGAWRSGRRERGKSGGEIRELP